ncbi:SseB family protein [Pseudomonas fluorescens]|nr:SseB family protein [Pseudomonas fluorescens]
MDTQPENLLEKSLKLAADEPAHRPEFFNTLLNSNVYILGTAGEADGHVNLQAGSNISIAHWQKPDGTPVIPFFRHCKHCNSPSTASSPTSKYPPDRCSKSHWVPCSV